MHNFLPRTITLTGDGSATFYIPELDEHYHSIHGAVQESKHVFIKMGWEEFVQRPDAVSVLEIGFGTGLNAFLVARECKRSGRKAVYTPLEAFPMTEEEWKLVNYADEEEKELFAHLNRAEWNKEVAVTENFTLKKMHTRLDAYSPENEMFDLVFFDAFGPRVQPEMWTEEVFVKMFSALKKGGMLVTYCAKGQVRRNMIAAGFVVERLQGPPGKREMLRARKENGDNPRET